MHPVQCSSFSLMESLAHPAASRGRPTHHAARAIRHTSHYPRSCLICQACFPSIWAAAPPQQDPSPVASPPAHGATTRSCLLLQSKSSHRSPPLSYKRFRQRLLNSVGLRSVLNLALVTRIEQFCDQLGNSSSPNFLHVIEQLSRVALM